MADRRLGRCRRGKNGVEIHAGADAHLFEQVDGLLGRDVAARSGRERAATQPANRRVELHHADLHGGEHVRDPGPARVVEVDANLQSRASRSNGLNQLDYARRRGRSDRVAQAELIRTLVGGAPRDLDRPRDRRSAVERAIPRNRDDHLAPSACGVRDPGYLPDEGYRGVARHTGIGQAVPVGRGYDVFDVTDAGLGREAGAFGIGHERRPRDVRPAVQLGGYQRGIGHRRHGAGRDERRRLDPAYPGLCERVEHGHLGIERDQPFELQAVPRTHLADVDGRRQAEHAHQLRSRPGYKGWASSISFAAACVRLATSSGSS